MSRVVSEVTIHYCDGCGKEAVQFAKEDLPVGFYIQVTDIAHGSVLTGDLYVCGVKCILRAFRRRQEIWEPEKWKSTNG